MSDKPLVSDSKLYLLSVSEPPIQFLTPDLNVQIAVETQVNEEVPRTEKDADHTRILMNYTNARGNSLLTPLTDDLRLNREFDIDHFMNGYVTAIAPELAKTTGLPVIDLALLEALRYSVLTLLNIEKAPATVKPLCTAVLSSIVAAIYNDPLDVMIAVQEMEVPTQPGTFRPAIAAIWVVKARNTTIPESFGAQ